MTMSLFDEVSLRTLEIEDIITVLKRMKKDVENNHAEDELLIHHQTASKMLSNLGVSLHSVEGEGARGRILAYMLKRVGEPLDGNTLRSVAGISEWPRRIRELRVEHGWKIKTQKTGRSDLPSGVYLLESGEQDEPHDRGISDQVRLAVLQRDQFRCQHSGCNWSLEDRTHGDPRYTIELHHVHEIADGGNNDAVNLVAVCNVHHKAIHSRCPAALAWLREWLIEQRE